ncbi:hypothetical protein C8J56DRAFT_1157681 [Mycena floridula]|nr:hypothetical protein C8J56DRAFT_1157681 [Mycena floridula]
MDSPLSLCCKSCGIRYIDEIPVPYTQGFPESRSNNPPNSIDIPAIQADIVVRQGETQALQTQIDTLSRALHALESRKSASQEALRRNQGILHPIRAVPRELLRAIFRYCTSQQGPENVDLRSPQNLPLVCQRWRRISISCPELWSTIELGHRKTGRISPLDVILGPGYPQYRPISSVLIKSSARWRTLDLLMRTVDVLRNVCGHLDSLTDLCISFGPLIRPREIHSYWQGVQGLPSKVGFFEVAPSLRRVKLVLNAPEVSIKLPWATLVELTVQVNSSWTRRRSLALPLTQLPLCQNLRIARLHAVSSETIDKISQVMILPELTSLYLETSYTSGPGKFLDKLIAPALKSLHLRTIEYKTEFPNLNSVTSMVTRSGCSLKEVEFSQMTMLGDIVHTSSFLSSSPEISRFIADEYSSLLSLLVTSPDAPIFLPKLTDLVIMVDEDDIKYFMPELLYMLESRLQRKPTTLKTAEIDRNCDRQVSVPGF